MKTESRGRGRPKKQFVEKEDTGGELTFNEANNETNEGALIIDTPNNESEFKCQTCERAFPSSSSLKKHACKNAYSNKKRLVACEYCVKTFCTQNAYNRHLNANHFNKKIICNVCSKEFKLKRLLMQHHYDEHTQTKIFQCDICNVSFSWKKNLEKHRISCEIEQQRKEHFSAQDQLTQALSCQDNRSTIIFQSIAQVAKPWICTICGKDFQYDFSFKAHMAGHDFNGQSNLLGLEVADNSYRCEEDEVEILVEVTNNGDAEIQMIQDSYQLNSQISAFKQTTECLNKNYETKNYGNLYVTNEKPFACEYCDMQFMWQMSLDGHIKQEHYLLTNKLRQHKKTGKSNSYNKMAVSKILYERDSEEEEGDEIDHDEERHDSSAAAIVAATPEASSYSNLEAYLMGDSASKDSNVQVSKFVTGLANILGNKQSAASQVVESIRMQKSSSSNISESVLSDDKEMNAFASLNYVPVEYSVENGHLALYLSNDLGTDADAPEQQRYLIATDVLCGMLNNQTSDLSTILSPEEYELIINNANIVAQASQHNTEMLAQTDVPT